MINIPSAIKISLRALRVNKMRSALTTLGIIIGVGAVIAMLAIGTGASQKIEEQIASVGSNLLIVLPGATTAGGVRMGAGTQPTLSLGDAEAIQKDSPAVLYAAPVHNGVGQVVYGSQNWSTMVTGTTPGMLEVKDWPLAQGRPFTEEEVRSAAKVGLLGQTVVDNLFGGIDPVGQIIRIKNIPFTVIGVLGRKGQSPIGQDQDDTIMIPVTTAQKKLFGTSFPGMIRIIMVKAKSTEDLYAAEKQIVELIRQRHHIGQKQEDDFTVRNLTQMMQAAEDAGYKAAIHNRGPYAVAYRRHIRDRHRGLGLRGARGACGLGYGGIGAVNSPGLQFFRYRRNIFRVLSGIQGLFA